MTILTINKFHKEYFERLRKEVQAAETPEDMQNVLGEVYCMLNSFLEFSISGYILKSEKLSLQNDKHRYCVFDQEYNHVHNLYLTPKQAKSKAMKMNLQWISPMELYKAEMRKIKN